MCATRDCPPPAPHLQRAGEAVWKILRLFGVRSGSQHNRALPARGTRREAIRKRRFIQVFPARERPIAEVPCGIGSTRRAEGRWSGRENNSCFCVIGLLRNSKKKELIKEF